MPPELVAELQRAAGAERAALVPVDGVEHRAAVAELSRRADAEQNADPAYRAEIRAWSSADPHRRDGVPALAVPHVDGSAIDDIPIRDFDSHGAGWLPSRTGSSQDQCLLLLTTDEDDPRSWLRAGQALQRVLLEVARRGYKASPLTQVVEVPATRAALRSALDLPGHPLVLFRLGRALPTPGTLRRPLDDVLVERTTGA